MLRAITSVLVPLSAGALRKGNSKTRQLEADVLLADVPIINYRYRFLQNTVQHGGADSSYDWVIKFKDGLDDDSLVKFCGGDAGAGACWALGQPGRGGLPLATVRGTETDLRKLLTDHPGLVEFVEPDSPVELEPDSTVQDVTVSSDTPWNLERINIGSAGFTGDGVHIYVMDTGVRVSHEDFGGRAIPQVDTIAGGGKVTECQPGEASCAKDDNGHGTHVAGTAGGTFYGAAKKAELHAMKVCCGSGTNINAGMDWIARNAQKPAVMTMSLGSYSTPESSRVAVDAVVASGVTVTVSAGNRGTDSCQKSYTFIASALGVGASTIGNERASFSNWGTCNAIFAPGRNILSASHSSDTGGSTKSGTSMAAPLVAGAAAMLLEEDPSLTPAGVRSRLRERANAGALSSLKTGDPNLLLWVGSEPAPVPVPTPPTPAPTPAPTPPGICPSDTTSGPDRDGDCRCKGSLSCYRNGQEGCPVQWQSKLSPRYYHAPTCADCKCL